MIGSLSSGVLMPGAWPASCGTTVSGQTADTPEQQDDKEEASSRPARNTPLRQRDASTLQWMQRRMNANFADIRTGSAAKADTARAEDCAKAAALLERCERAIDETSDLGPESAKADIQSKAHRKYEELSGLLDEIRTLTQSLDPDIPLPGAPQLSLPADQAQNGVLEQALIGLCLEILNTLPYLRHAMERSAQPVPGSEFQYQFALDENYRLSPAEIETMLTHAAFAHTIYADSVDSNLAQADRLLGKALPESWSSMPMPEDVRKAFETVCPHLQHLADGRFCDRDSGLVGQIFSNPGKKEITLAFGGTTSGEQKGTLLERQRGNSGITFRQWRTNISGATGMAFVGDTVPDSYSRAAQLAKLLQQSPEAGGGGWSISLTGHSKGGAEAEYAALKTGLPATCFGSPELSKAVLERASEKELKAGARNIRHYFVEGDPTPYIGSLFAPVLGRRQAHVGTTYTMKPDDALCTGWLKRLWCHDLFYASTLREAERQLE